MRMGKICDDGEGVKLKWGGSGRFERIGKC